MERVESDRGHVYVLHNYVYRCNRSSNGVLYLKCTVARCPSRVQYTEGQRPESSPHNHLPDEVAVEMLHFRRELREAARQNLEMTPRGIFDAISMRFPRAAAGVGFPAVRSTIHRIRARNTPVVPRSLPHYGELLHSAEWAHLNVLLNDDARRPFFREVIGGVAEGWMAGVYVSARLADALAGTVRLHMDATFKVMPAGLHAYQLLTVHAEYMNYLFPVAFAVMTRKTQQAYLGVFHFIAAAIPTLSPAVIMTDFEPAMKNAAQIVWPTSLLRGCYFHYTQAVYRMHSVLRMREVMDANLEADWALHLLLALALLPADRVPIGLAVIRHYVDQHNLANQFRALLGYMDNFWLRTVGPGTFSVYQQSHRTNNALEGFYSRLQEQMGPHPGVWLFHDRLRNIEQAQWLDLQRLMNGIRHVRPRRRAYMRQDVNIYEAQHLLTQGRYNEAQFLHRMAHCTKSLVATLRGHRGRRDALGVVADGAGAIQRRPAVPLMPPPIPIQPGPDGAAIHAAGAAQEDVQDVPLDPVPLPIAPEAPVDVVEDDNHVPDVRPPGTCVTCLVERATHCFFPCCHRCMCAACVGLLRQHNRAHICPCCRAPVDEILHIYDV